MYQARAALALLVLVVFSGCANPYHEFYHGVASPPAGGLVGFVPPQEAPHLVAMSGDPAQDINAMYQQGYGLAGYSDFTGRAFNQDLALEQAQKIGAEVVLVSSKYLSTESGVIPMTTPTTSTALSTGTASAYGSGGWATGSYTGLTTVYGSETTYIPYSIDRYQQSAFYFGRLSRTGLGVMVRAASDQEKQEAGTNSVLGIRAVRDGSPAFNADILPGDLLMSIGGQPAGDASEMLAAERSVGTQPAEVVLFRSGQRISKMVQIPTSW